MDKSSLQTIILDQQSFGMGSLHIPRLQNEIIEDKEIVVLSGIRRCGKSTLLQEIRSKFVKNNYYLNFDDDRLIKFMVEDFQVLYEIFIEMFGIQDTFFFDEIQNIKGWERFVRRLYDNGNKIFITGSNASMLSRELGTHLTGRYYSFELFPFSFVEFIQLKTKNIYKSIVNTSIEKGEIKGLFNEYFKMGGFPAYLISGNRQYIKSLYESIIYRDVIVRNKLTNEKEMLELLYYLASNVSKMISYNSLTKVIGVKNATTVKEYMDSLKNTYLIFLVQKFDYSLKVQIQNPKKVYFIDNALVKELGFFNSDDNGRFLENMVFIELMRRTKEVFYHKAKKECDFLIREKNKVVAAIQVCWSIYDEKTRAREIEGLIEAMTLNNLSKGLILTDSEEELITINSHIIQVVPVWKWFLTDTSTE